MSISTEIDRAIKGFYCTCVNWVIIGSYNGLLMTRKHYLVALLIDEGQDNMAATLQTTFSDDFS